jgi:hypothetical protein
MMLADGSVKEAIMGSSPAGKMFAPKPPETPVNAAAISASG